MDAFLDRLLEQDTQILKLQADLKQRDKTIEGIKHWLKVAATYKADDTQRQLEGVQAALFKAAEYEGRRPNNRKRK